MSGDDHPASGKGRGGLRKFSSWIGIFLLGAVIGPVLIAAAQAWFAARDPGSGFAAADRLLASLDSYFPAELHMLTLDWTGPVDECGYDYGELFPGPEMATDERWTAARGYFDLFLWRQDRFRDRARFARAVRVQARLEPFAIDFLRRCMDATLFAPFCAGYVRNAIESGDPPRLPPQMRHDHRREMLTICAMLDGVAARRGLPLARTRRLGAD